MNRAGASAAGLSLLLMVVLTGCSGEMNAPAESKTATIETGVDPDRRAAVHEPSASLAYAPPPERASIAWLDDEELLERINLGADQRAALAQAREQLLAERAAADWALLENRRHLGRIMREGSPEERQAIVEQRSVLNRQLAEAEASWSAVVTVVLSEPQLRQLRDSGRTSGNLRPAGMD